MSEFSALMYCRLIRPNCVVGTWKNVKLVIYCTIQYTVYSIYIVNSIFYLTVHQCVEECQRKMKQKHMDVLICSQMHKPRASTPLPYPPPHTHFTVILSVRQDGGFNCGKCKELLCMLQIYTYVQYNEDVLHNPHIRLLKKPDIWQNIVCSFQPCQIDMVLLYRTE